MNGKVIKGILIFLMIQMVALPSIFGAAIEKEEPVPQEVVTIDEVDMEKPPFLITTPEEMVLVSKVVAAECRGEPELGKIAVAQCIRDRAALWDLTPTEVVIAPGQFAAPYKGEVSREVYQAVFEVFFEDRSAFDDPVTHFHSIAVTPYWASEHPCYGQIGRQVFYGSN